MLRFAPLSALALSLTAGFIAPRVAEAGEGMWLPEQLEMLAGDLESLGLELDPAALGDLDQAPLGAVISLGGCSASFVSPQGLVVTNHHCAVSALQMNSAPDANLLQDGFYAETQADEIWAGPGSRVYVTESLTDVTSAIVDVADAAEDDAARHAAIDLAKKELVAECEADAGYRCSVATYDGGAAYRLIRQLEIEDVRIAYAPPSGVGFYGGDEDNWMWPRHTGDWTFFRAYVAPDGSPAPHSAENVPYQPAHHLTVSTEALDPGDLVMVAGYPGRTYRHRLGLEMAHARDAVYPWNVETMTDILAILDGLIEADEEAEVRLAGLRFGLANYRKNNQGMLDGFVTSGAVEAAERTDAELMEWLAVSPNANAPGWAAAIEELEATIRDSHATADRDRILGWMTWTVDTLDVASTAYRLTRERAIEDDLERQSGYQERDWPRIAERIARMDRTFYAPADVAMLAFWLERADALPSDQRIEAIDDLLEATEFDLVGDTTRYEAIAAQLLANTTLTDGEARAALLDAPVEDFEFSADPIIALAVALAPLRETNEARDEARGGAGSRLRPQYLAAVRAMTPGPMYPDANGTLRVTYGMVRGYSPRDAVQYDPFTAVEGIVEKHTGEEPFDAPDDLLAAIESGEWGPYRDPRLDSVPVNFLSTLDTTGGNSGSVTLNGRGELCGLLFDGNYEAMASDWLFDPVKTRSIHVHALYMLWSMDRVDGAHRLLREMGIEPAF